MHTFLWFSSWDVRRSLYSARIWKEEKKKNKTVPKVSFRDQLRCICRESLKIISFTYTLQLQLYCWTERRWSQSLRYMCKFQRHHHIEHNGNLTQPISHQFWTELAGEHNCHLHSPKLFVSPVQASNSVESLSNVW